MPNIQPYEAPQLGLEPTERGIDANQQAARRIGAFYDQAGQDMTQLGARIGSAVKDVGDAGVKVIEHHEVATGAANFAALQDNLTQQWNETVKNADPNNPAVAQKFREQVLEPALQQFSDKGFLTEGGRNWAQSHAIALRQHMFEKTSSDMSTLAGIAAQENFATVGNRLASTARLDPSSLDFQLKMADTSLGGIIDSSPTLTPADRARLRSEGVLKLKENIVKSAVIGMIEKNPNVDLSAIEKKYGDYITGPEMQLFQKSAQVQARKDVLLERQTQLIQKQQDELKVHADANKAFTDNVSVDPVTNRPIIKPQYFNDAVNLARNNPNAPNAATTARTLLDWGEHQQNLKDETVRTDPATRTDLTDRMFSADKPTTQIDILRAEADRKLSHTDAAPLLALNKALTEEPLRDPVWHDTINAVKGELVLSGVGLPGKDIAGEANYAKWAQTFVPQYLAAKRAGTLPPNALDVKDPKSMISQSMAPFKRTVADRMKDYVSVLGNLSDQNITGVKVENAPPAPALPPKEQLVKGSRYSVPGRGEMTWTGTGFVK